jgi:hypothetical protein
MKKEIFLTLEGPADKRAMALLQGRAYALKQILPYIPETLCDAVYAISIGESFGEVQLHRALVGLKMGEIFYTPPSLAAGYSRSDAHQSLFRLAWTTLNDLTSDAGLAGVLLDLRPIWWTVSHITMGDTPKTKFFSSYHEAREFARDLANSNAFTCIQLQEQEK